MSPFQTFAPLLRKRGFRKDGSQRAGIRTDFWEKDLGNGRVLELQLWGDGRHRISHSSVTERGGRSCVTVPTGFTDEAGLDAAIEFEVGRPHEPFFPEQH